MTCADGDCVHHTNCVLRPAPDVPSRVGSKQRPYIASLRPLRPYIQWIANELHPRNMVHRSPCRLPVVAGLALLVLFANGGGYGSVGGA